MTLPSSEEFDAWLNHAKNRPSSISAPPKLSSGFDIKRDELLSFLLSADEERMSAWRWLWEHPVGRWIGSQRSFTYAYELVHRKSRKRLEGDSQSQRFNATERAELDLERILLGADRELNRRRIADPGTKPADEEFVRRSFINRQLVHRATNSFKDNWQCQCVSAIAEYLPGEVAASLLYAARSIEHSAMLARNAIEEYVEHAKVIRGLGFPASQDRRWISLDIIEKLKNDIPIPSRNSIPLRREDERSDERLFVYRIWSANMHHVRAPRTEAIAELMGIEGFRHQYDTRNIERLCANFTGTKLVSRRG